MNTALHDPGTVEAVLLSRAASQSAQHPSDQLFSAAITLDGQWLRLSPALTGNLPGHPPFKRWDMIRFRAKEVGADMRRENRRIELGSLQVMGELARDKRAELLQKVETRELRTASELGRTLALVRPRKPLFFVQRKTPDEINLDIFESQQIAGPNATMVEAPFPYKFRYRYTDDNGEQEMTFRDWEMRDTLGNLARSFGDAQALSRVIQLWGKDYPQKGMFFILSRDTATSFNWIINTLLTTDEVEDMTARSINLIA